MIDIQALHKFYGKHQILQNLNLNCEKGKVYGIVGENGAGKTTLFKCIAGLESYEGNIQSEIVPLKDHLGFLQTDLFFFPKITGKEYIQLLCNARNISLGNFDEKNIFDLPLEEYAINYSTGMKKKLALTAILLQQNEVFILDEPFNGVDIQSNMMITEIIHRLKKAGKTLLISSHIFSTLRDTCDEIHLLQKGTFSKKVLPTEYDLLEAEMKDTIIGNKIDFLGLG